MPSLKAPRRTPRPSALHLAGLLTLASASCGLPEYRMLVTNIPKDGKALEVAAYVQATPTSEGALPSDRIVADIPSGRTELAVSVNLRGLYNAPDSAVFAAIVRDVEGCITAVGYSDRAAPSPTVADIELPLLWPKFPAASRQRCSATGPVLLDVQRHEQGPYGKTDFRLLVAGWDVAPTDQVTAKSLMVLQPTSCQFKSCTDRCRDTVSCLDAAGGTVECRTGCTLTTIAEYLGPSRLILHIPEADNVVQDSAGGRTLIKESATLATMRGSPFQVTILRAATGQSSSYTESKATQP